MDNLLTYKVVAFNAPYYHYIAKDGKISLKDQQGNLPVRKEVAGTIVGRLLINIDSGLKGEQPPPYAMYLAALDELPSESV